MKYQRLFTPITIKPGFTLKNRIIMPAIHSGFSKDGTLSDQFREYYRTRAAGGAGLLVVGACRFEDTGAHPDVLKLDSDEDIEMWRPFIDEIHALDCRIAAQLFHAGRYVAGGTNVSGGDALAPSAVYSSFSRDTPREITVEEIHKLIEGWAAGAVRAKAAGFDAVEIIGSAGYLITQFLSPVTNLRTDEYGGSTENRRRFPLEVVRAVRAAVGEEYPIIYRMSGKDFISGSNGLQEATELAALLEEAGVDLLNVTGGWHETTVPQLPGDLPQGGLSYLAEGVKQVVKIPVVACNRISTPEIAEEILATGKADLVGMARVLVADPDLPNKALSGRADEIRPCVACNQGCLVGAFFGRPLCCLANGLAGYEYELKPMPRKGERVLVIGGGCAGCECAIRLAERGYAVTLWERSGALGGQLQLVAVCPAKEDFGRLIRYYENRLAALGVQVELNRTADADAVADAGFDRVVVAVGGQPNPVKLQHETMPIVTAEDILTGEVIPGKNVVVVGGSFKGVETARFIARKSAPDAAELFYLITQRAETPETAAEMANHSSRNITLVEKNKKVGFGYEPGVAWTVMQDLHRLHVRTKKQTVLLEINADSVTVESTDKEGNITRKVLPCDTLVYAAGVHADESLTETLTARGIEAISVGNCARVGRAIDAIRAAARIGMTF